MRYFKPILTLTKIFILRTARDRMALFFIFLFPLIFLFVFGTIFSNDSTSFRAVIINNSSSEFAKEFVEKMQTEPNNVFQFNQQIKTLAEAKQAMDKDKIFITFVLNEDFGKLNSDNIPSGKVLSYYNQGKESTGVTAVSVMESILHKINLAMGQPEAALQTETKLLTTRGASQFDYIFSGIIGFSLLGSGIFGLGMGIPGDKKTGALKRLMVSSLRPSQLLLAYGFMTAFYSMLSFSLLAFISVLVFQLNMQGSWLAAYLLVFLGSVLLIGIGIMVGGWSQNENQASPLANILGFPLMILSGTFFPRYLMPEWLQNITEYTPLTPIIDGIHKIVIGNSGFLDLYPQVLLMFVWIIIFYVLAFKLFRWE